MKDDLLQDVKALSKQQRRRNGWQSAVRIMIAIVVFCTTYALILPAITMENDAQCGMEAHEHSPDCYHREPVEALVCGMETSPLPVIHSHNEICYDAQGNLICALQELEAHAHGEGCYAQQTVNVCRQPEAEAHTHTDSCYEIGMIPCTQPEVPGHSHSEECYNEEHTLTCGKMEMQGHSHSEACMKEGRILSCGQEQTRGHSHTAACTRSEQVLVCGKIPAMVHTHTAQCGGTFGMSRCDIQEAVEHQHTQQCLTETGETLEVLVCQKPEHIHTDACYPVKEEDAAHTSGYLCASTVHEHTELCYNADGYLSCSIPAHVHEAACLVADLDLTADVEQSYQWEEPIRQLMLTGYWPEDVLSVAKTQLGYRESTRNVILENGALYGYTRYGAWYGHPYGDWCAMFASFCMKYAGVEGFPFEASCTRWIEALSAQDSYRTPDVYTPKAGDLIFFLKNDAFGSDHVGLVAEVIPATYNTPAQIRTIEGNSDNTVQYVTYELSDASIVGYGVLPQGPVRRLSSSGADYTVTVTFREDAGIPENAVLTVREILPGTEEYETYYQQSIQRLLARGGAETEEELEVSFARFFDISFVVDGMIIEPTAGVNIRITYTDPVTMTETDAGMAIHFADDGIEVLDAQASREAFSEAEGMDTFRFSQNSFSVTGIIVVNATRVPGVYTTEKVNALDSSGNTRYVVYTKYNGRYYALDGNGGAVEITLDANGNITSTINNNNLLWTFTYNSTNTHSIYNVGTGRYMHSYYNNAYNWGVTTSGNYTSTLELTGEGDDLTFRVRSNSNYSMFNGSFQVTQNADSAARFYIAALPPTNYHVWFDGTNGGLMGLYGSDNTYQSVPANNNTITLPESWKSPSKYTYKLKGWYDIVSNTYYPAGTTVTITQNTVFYADWVAGTYDVGFDNEDAVESLDTDSFITTYVFDYNSLFNVQSLAHLGSINASGHTEYWNIIRSGKVPYQNANTLNFAFVDYDANGDFSYPSGRDVYNINQSTITEGVLDMVDSVSGASDKYYLLHLLFDPSTQVIGKNYVGTGNYLYQYMDSTTSNYDGHDGYYYFHSRLNAASYNQSQGRFYLYSYLERTTDSWKDGGVGEFSDFLPFNSPYANIPEGQALQTYTADTRALGYQYDAKDNYYQNNTWYSQYGNAGTNYWFGIRSDVEFFLPNDPGDVDEYGNYGNISTRGQHMVFEFHGDDDVWVFVDGMLMLDVGGVHGVEYGEIDFSTGVVTSGDGDSLKTRTFEEILGEGHTITEGTHVMTVYYMERGSSQSNCSIYFNLAPRYDLEITKQDVFTAAELDGAVFGIYNDEACTDPAQLWTSRAAYDADMDDGTIDDSIYLVTVHDGVAACWGLSAGKTYFIREETPPEGYPKNDDIIRVTLNNRGTATIETTTLHGPDGDAAEGFAVIEQNVNDTLKIVALTVTNQKEGDVTELQVVKQWAEGSTNLPESITVYLTLNGVRVGRTATLSENNGWSYTWTGLPKWVLDESGVPVLDSEGNKILAEYQVEEVLVPNFNTEEISYQSVTAHVSWIQTDRMEDSMTYLLVHNGMALAYKNGSFTWITIEAAKSDITAQWSVTTDHYGFHVTNGENYAISLDKNTHDFYGTNNHANEINQVLYYADSQLMAQQDDIYYFFGENGDGVASDGLIFNLYRREEITGFLVNIENAPVEEDAQTHVEVNKVWADGEDHSDDAITVRLYADGKDTGRVLILSQANSWQGSFEDLPYYGADGVTPVVYTVVEDEPSGYEAHYSDPTTVTGRDTVVWLESGSLINDATFRFTKGSYSMASADTGAVISKSNNLTDAYQQWKVVSYYGSYRLQNVGNGRYLRYDSTDGLTTVNNIADSTAVTMSGSVMQISGRYLMLNGTTISTSQHAYNGTVLTATYQNETTEMPGVAYTITNTVAEYLLPETGGNGLKLLTFGGLLTVAVALMYIIFPAKTKRKGDYR